MSKYVGLGVVGDIYQIRPIGFVDQLPINKRPIYNDVREAEKVARNLGKKLKILPTPKPLGFI